jgi:hypothetical protein
MSSKTDAPRPRVSGSVPHPSWNLDRPIIFSREADDRRREKRTVTPEEIWAVVDGAN